MLLNPGKWGTFGPFYCFLRKIAFLTVDLLRKYFAPAVLLCGGLLFLVACANQTPLTGGEKDTEAPKLDSTLSTRNFQTNFKKQEIALYFDEWVQLKDVFNQVVVSPPLAKRPVIERRKKSIRFRFDDEEILHDSATYVINFGNAIVDLNESNPAEIVFVFSTGPYIDSLSVSGSVVDAYTGKPVEKALFMLYENTADSVVRTERPFYFARTDRDGNFTISNVKTGTFKAVALVDENLNYKYDGQNEKIGFLDTLLKVLPPPKPLAADTAKADSLALVSDSLALPQVGTQPDKVRIRLFQEKAPLFLKDRETRTYGQVKLVFSREPDSLVIGHEDIGQKVLVEQRADTVVVWYDTPADTTWKLFVRIDEERTDTIEVDKRPRDLFLSGARVKLQAERGPKPEEIHPDTSLSLNFNFPVDGVEESAFILSDDSTKATLTVRIQKDGENPRRLFVRSAWKEGRSYTLSLLPGAVTTFFGISNADTLVRTFKTQLRKDFGSLTLRVKDLSANKNYVVRLLSSQKEVFATTVSGKEEAIIRKGALAPGIYEVEIIEDLDNNGKWTTGNYDEHRQPERLFRKALEQMRANWELDVAIEPTFE
ncbi:MAG: Ig-like domain-containing protein [Saprospiraceae bacterium]